MHHNSKNHASIKKLKYSQDINNLPYLQNCYVRYEANLKPKSYRSLYNKA